MKCIQETYLNYLHNVEHVTLQPRRTKYQWICNRANKQLKLPSIIDSPTLKGQHCQVDFQLADSTLCGHQKLQFYLETEYQPQKNNIKTQTCYIKVINWLRTPRQNSDAPQISYYIQSVNDRYSWNQLCITHTCAQTGIPISPQTSSKSWERTSGPTRPSAANLVRRWQMLVCLFRNGRNIKWPPITLGLEYYARSCFMR